MARKESIFIAESGRDVGKKFHITEMSATQAEAWAIKALLAIGNSGIDIPEGLIDQGMAGLVAISYMNLLKIPFKVAEPLLEEMMSCVKIMPSDSSNIKRNLFNFSGSDRFFSIKLKLKLEEKRMELLKTILKKSRPDFNYVKRFGLCIWIFF